MQKAACNKLGKKNNSIISIRPNMEYCFSGFASNRFFNLTNNVVMALYKENLAGGYIVRISQKFLPAILVLAIIGGATGIAGSIGDSIMDGKEICVSDVIVTAVSGVITGAAVPIMTPGIIGGIAATGLGVSAKGMCTSCHLGSDCGGGKQ